jgi:membrane-bound serine protease (ClpP class)
MEFLLDPNVAYIILTFGMLIAILAMLAPGTGLLEVGAFLLLFIAGYEIYNLPINLWSLGILILAIIPFVFAIRKTYKWYYMALSMAAMIAGSIFLFKNEQNLPAVDPLLAVITSLVVVGFFWIVVIKGVLASKMKPSHILTDVVGTTGETRTKVYKEGSVYAAGEMWSAWSKEPIPENSRVKIISKDGFILEVEKIENS